METYLKHTLVQSAPHLKPGALKKEDSKLEDGGEGLIDHRDADHKYAKHTHTP